MVGMWKNTMRTGIRFTRRSSSWAAPTSPRGSTSAGRASSVGVPRPAGGVRGSGPRSLVGGIFADHCSPISDTTVLSSLACGSDLMDHVVTQLPIAMTAAGFAIVIYTAIALTLTL